MEGSANLIKAGATAGGSIGSRFASAGHEIEADYLSTHLLVRAGIDAVEALLIWDRLSEESDIAQKHHNVEARFEDIFKSLEEVNAKRDSNEPLVPNPNRKVTSSTE